MLLNELIGIAAELFPEAEDAEPEAYGGILSELLEFAVVTEQEVRLLWSEVSDRVMARLDNDWRSLEEKNPDVLKSRSRPWCSNRVGILRHSLEEKFDPYWKLYRAKNDETITENVIKEHFTPRFPIRPHQYEYFARIRTLGQVEKFLSDLQIQFTSPFLFPDIFDAQRAPNIDFDGAVLEAELRQHLEQIVFAPTEPNISIVGNPLNLIALLGAGLRRKAKSNADEVRKTLAEAGPDSAIFKLRAMSMDELSKFNQSLRAAIDTVRICCLTSVDALRRPRLWVEFGKNHTGCAVVFRSPSHRRNIFWDAKSVYYAEEPHPLVSAREWSAHILGIQRINLVNRVLKHLLYKAQDYQNEDESRIIQLSQNLPDVGNSVQWLTLHPSDVVALIGGMNSDAESFQSVASTCNRLLPHVQVLKCLNRPGSAQFQFENYRWAGL